MIWAYLVSNGVIPSGKSPRLCHGNAKERLRETCLSCIGNLSAYTSECRDLLLQSGVLVPLLTQLGTPQTEGRRLKTKMTVVNEHEP